MIKFISKLLKSLFVLSVSGIIFIFLFSFKSDMSFKSTIAYFQTIGSEILNINNNENIIANTTPDNLIVIISDGNRYYYQQLDDTAKIIYTTIENNIDNLKEENYIIDFTTQFNDLLNTSTGKYKLNKSFQSALDAFFYDHPELFYIDLSSFSLNTKCISIGPKKTYTVEIAPKNNNYLHSSFKSKQEINSAINKVTNIKNNVVNKASKYDTYGKIKYVHDVLVNSIQYDSNQQNAHNIYGALIDKKVVCEGYAKAFKYIMDNLNIECILVSGNATNTSGQSEAHMWNYVELDGNWYGVDVTWDDPIIVGGSHKNNLRHDYFLKGIRAFITSHNSTGKISETGMLFDLPSLSNSNYKK